MVFMAMFSDKLGSWYDTRYFRLTGNNDGNFDHKSEGLSKYLNQNKFVIRDMHFEKCHVPKSSFLWVQALVKEIHI